MKINQLLLKSKEIWGDEKLKLSSILVRMGVVFGEICRYERNDKKDKGIHNDTEIKKELGNMIFSTIRWCDDLGYDPDECIEEAIRAQREFVNKNRNQNETVRDSNRQ